ncbi:MAG TPA: hypothetical protein VGH44_06200 [Candidatus Saccharimonadia bacterium]
MGGSKTVGVFAAQTAWKYHTLEPLLVLGVGGGPQLASIGHEVDAAIHYLLLLNLAFVQFRTGQF